MKKAITLGLFVSLIVSTFAIANEVNIFNARHYKADKELYSKFTDKTGIKVNLINGKASALEKRMIEEGTDSSADLYITADAGRCGAFKAKGMTQSGSLVASVNSVCSRKSLLVSPCCRSISSHRSFCSSNLTSASNVR